MNHYDDNEIAGMTNEELKQFLGIADKLLKKANASYTKVNISLDQARKRRDLIDFCLDDTDDYDGLNSCPYSYAELKASHKKVAKYAAKASELDYEIAYLKKTIGRAKVEFETRESIKAGRLSFTDLVQDELDDIFGED